MAGAGGDSRPASRDPMREWHLKLDKKVRRLALARGGAADPDELHASADEFFPLPDDRLVFWPRRNESNGSIDPDDLVATPKVP